MLKRLFSDFIVIGKTFYAQCCCKYILCGPFVVAKIFYVTFLLLLLLLFKRRYVWHLSWKDVLCDAFDAEETLKVMLLLKSCCVWHWSWRDHLEMLYMYVMLLFKSCYMWRIRCSEDIFYDIMESVGGWVAVPRIPEFRLVFDVRNLKNLN